MPDHDVSLCLRIRSVQYRLTIGSAKNVLGIRHLVGLNGETHEVNSCNVLPAASMSRRPRLTNIDGVPRRNLSLSCMLQCVGGTRFHHAAPAALAVVVRAVQVVGLVLINAPGAYW